jgi:hypothetical protein
MVGSNFQVAEAHLVVEECPQEWADDNAAVNSSQVVGTPSEGIDFSRCNRRFDTTASIFLVDQNHGKLSARTAESSLV